MECIYSSSSKWGTIVYSTLNATLFPKCSSWYRFTASKTLQVISCSALRLSSSETLSIAQPHEPCATHSRSFNSCEFTMPPPPSTTKCVSPHRPTFDAAKTKGWIGKRPASMAVLCCSATPTTHRQTTTWTRLVKGRFERCVAGATDGLVSQFNSHQGN